MSSSSYLKFVTDYQTCIENNTKPYLALNWNNEIVCTAKPTFLTTLFYRTYSLSVICEELVFQIEKLSSQDPTTLKVLRIVQSILASQQYQPLTDLYHRSYYDLYMKEEDQAYTPPLTIEEKQQLICSAAQKGLKEVVTKMLKDLWPVPKNDIQTIETCLQEPLIGWYLDAKLYAQAYELISAGGDYSNIPPEKLFTLFCWPYLDDEKLCLNLMPCLDTAALYKKTFETLALRSVTYGHEQVLLKLIAYELNPFMSISHNNEPGTILYHAAKCDMKLFVQKYFSKKPISTQEISAIEKCLQKPLMQIFLEQNRFFDAHIHWNLHSDDSYLPKMSREILEPFFLYFINDSGLTISKLPFLILQQEPTLVETLSPLLQRLLASMSVQLSDEKYVLHLLKLNLDLDDITINKKSLLTLAIEKKWYQAAEEMLQRNMYLAESDQIILDAFTRQNEPLSKILITYIDPFKPNKWGYTPLASLFFRSDISQENKISFTKQLLKRTTKVALPKISISLDQFKMDLKLQNAFEVIFLLGNTDTRYVIQALTQISKEEFVDGCKNLCAYYPKKRPHDIVLFFYSFTQKHYEWGIERYIPEQAPVNVRISDLLALYDTTTLTEDRTHLETFVTNVEQRIAFLGTPPAIAPEALEYFYAAIELYTKHIISTLKQKNDPTLTENFLQALIEAGPLCGGRYFTNSHQQYLKICHGKEETFSDTLERTLAECRNACLETAITSLSPNDPHNIHHYNRALQSLGKALGLPGYHQALKFNDVMHGTTQLSMKAIENKFYEFYTPANIVLDSIYPILKTDLSFRVGYLNWHKENIVSHFKPEITDSDEREYAYLQDFVHTPQNELSIDALISCLEHHKVFNSPFSIKS